MPTNPTRSSLRSWRHPGVRVLWTEMRVLRVTLALGSITLVATAGCSSDQTEATVEPEFGGEPSRIPDPPPRYKRIEAESGISQPDDDTEPTLEIRCGGHRPYLCSLDDGTFRCSEQPCVPHCDRVGCLGGEVCISCDGEFRCVAPNDGC